MCDLTDVARDLNEQFIAAGFDETRLELQQVLCLAEEAGEFVGAYRRWRGMARRDGTEADAKSELADVVISAYVCADALGFDLDAAIIDKLAVIYSRGWRTTSENSAV